MPPPRNSLPADASLHVERPARFEYCELRIFRIQWAPRPHPLAVLATEKTMTPQVTLPRTQDIEAATTAQRELAAYLATGFETKLVQLVDSQGRLHSIQLPMAALQLLSEILSELADGNAVKIVPVHAELTTQEAADLLNVSRPYLVKLLETGKLAFHKTGKHRRIHFNDLMAYKQARDEESQSALDNLAADAQELGMGYGAART